MQKICSWAYELVVLLVLLIAALTPIHAHYTAHFNIEKTLNAHAIVFDDAHAGDTLHPGESLPVFRFNPDWETKIGDVHVTEIDGNKVYCNFDPDTFQWPMGNHGRVIHRAGDVILIDAGKKSGFKKDDIINLFRGRDFIGKAQITIAGNDASSARLTSEVSDNLMDATVTEYVYATQVSFLTNPLINVIEVIIFAAAILLWVYSSILGKLQPLTIIKEFVSRHLLKIDGIVMRLILNIAAGIPFIVVAVRFVLNIVHVFMAAVGLEAPDAVHPLLTSCCYLLAVSFYYGYLLKTKKSPILKFCSFFRYHPPSWEKMSRPFRRIILWTLHLVIAYVFGHTLFSFLLGDLQGAAAIAWPDVQVGTGWIDLVRALPHILVTMPHFSSSERFYRFFQLVVWAFAIIPGILGYGYSVLLDPFKGKIRNLDFTIAGWATTAICYGLVLGPAFWDSVPTYMGNDPIITQGPLLFLTWGGGMVLNVLYMLTLFNLGTMFGVMTDKGVRTTGFYSVVRHPSYTVESLMFLLTWIVGFSSFENWIGGLMFPLLYFIRSEREDHFMSVSNPEFLEYKKKVPYKYIPGVY